MRASGFMPQSVLSVTLSAGTALTTLRMRSAIFCGDSIGVGADVEDTDLRALVRGQVLEELDAVHVAIGVVEHELVDAGRAEEVREHRLIARRGSRR